MNNIQILMFMLILNIFMYLGGIHLLDNDIMSMMVDIQGDKVVDFSQEEGHFGEAIPSSPEADNTLTSNIGGFSFLDALRICWAAIKFLLNIVFAPIGLLIAGGFPLIVQLAVGVPISVAYIYGLVVLIRGGGG